MVTFCGRWGKRLHSGTISKHEVREFVLSCQSAGWDSVAVAEGYHIIAAMRNDKVWVKAEIA